MIKRWTQNFELQTVPKNISFWDGLNFLIKIIVGTSCRLSISSFYNNMEYNLLFSFKLLPLLDDSQPTILHCSTFLIVCSWSTWHAAPIFIENFKDSWRSTSAKSWVEKCWFLRDKGCLIISLTIIICVDSMSRIAPEFGGPANTTHSWLSLPELQRGFFKYLFVCLRKEFL